MSICVDPCQSAQYSGQFGAALLTGTIKGTSLTFSLQVSSQGTTVTRLYSSTVEDILEGTVRFGDMAKGTFMGRKK